MESDKTYWHRFMPEYERVVFSHLKHATHVLEWGVLESASIEYLSNRFPDVTIIGLDIDWRDSWFKNNFIKYFRVDQANRQAVNNFFKDYNNNFDLIIDDGSHDPVHQAICLLEGFPFLKAGGFYIVEDIHTNIGKPDAPLQFLLAAKHMKESFFEADKVEVALAQLESRNFSLNNLIYLYAMMDDIHFFKRACFPVKCWKCQQNAYNYKDMKCMCGEQLMSNLDSMTCMIRKAM